MRCLFCERGAWYRCARTGVLLCPEHARLEVVALRGGGKGGRFDVRAAVAEDYPHLEELALHFWGETEMECFERTYDVLKLPAFAAYDDDELVGFLSYAVEEDALNIVVLNVLPEHQGVGLGKELVKELVGEAKKRGLSRLIVATSNDNLSALYFYQRIGFVIEEVLPGRIVEYHGDVERGVGDIPVRDEVRLQLPLAG
jgi:ribosomal protein S18 acetylase RimI-like enzyme